MRVKSLMSLKVRSNLGLAKKKSKSPCVGRFLNFTYKSIDFKAEFGVKISDFHNLSLT